MRSGFSAAILSKSSPLSSDNTAGCAGPSLGCAHGHTAKGWSPHQFVTAFGTTPTASRSSCSVNPALTTRLGGAAILVSPKRCLTLTADGGALALCCAEHPVAVSSPAAAAIPAPPAPKRSRLLSNCIHGDINPARPSGQRHSFFEEIQRAEHVVHLQRSALVDEAHHRAGERAREDPEFEVVTVSAQTPAQRFGERPDRTVVLVVVGGLDL